MKDIVLLKKDRIVPELVECFSNARKSIDIFGPWLDIYFTRLLVNSLSKELNVKFEVREDDGVIEKKTLSALNFADQNLKNFQARSLENLHCKIILIDLEIFFLGSTNWYWYSLNKGIEVIIKGYTRELPDLIAEIEKYWTDGTPIEREIIKNYQDFKPVKDAPKL